MRSGFTGRLARVTAAHPWRTLGVWVVLLAVAFVLAGDLGNVLTDDGDLAVETEAEIAENLIDQHFPPDPNSGPTEFVLVEGGTITADDPAFQGVVTDLVADLRQTEGVASAVSYLDGAAPVSDDGTVALIPVEGTPDVGSGELAVGVVAATEAASGDGFRVTTIGNGSVGNEFDHLAEETLVRGESIGIGVALVILLFVFGAAVAAGLPLILAIGSILLAIGMTTIVGQAFELSNFVTNMITMIGLAVGIDYSLFIVQRFREERAKGHPVIEAVERAGDSATRAVFFSGVTVVIALLGLLYMPDTVMRSLGIGAILAVVAAVAAALTLLPAVLGLLGDRVNKGKLPFIGGTTYHEGGGRFWHRVTEIVTARPILSVVLAGGILLAAAAPYLTINTGSNSIASLPDDSPARHAWTVLNDNFDTGTISTWIVVDADPTDPEVAASTNVLVAALATDPNYGEATVTPSPDGAISLVEVVTKLDPSTLEANQAVVDLRETAIPAAFSSVADVYVTGDAAWNADYTGEIDARTPVVFVFVLGLSFVLLMVVFRSIVVPLKAIVMNLLSVGAAYGLLVAVFQHGFGADLLGFQPTDVIEAWVPMLMFAVLFGLSMDYHIFLLSRIKERYDVTGDNTGSVAFGLGSTGAIITGAALIMVAVFGGFAMGDLVMFQQMGFGLAIAVILDATIVRSILVPATMRLLGDRNWYLPPWLSWLPEIHIEGRHDVVDLRDDEPVPELV